MPYTNRDKIEKYLNADLSAIDSTVTSWIASVKAWIDKYCGRAFEAASTTKYYDGNRRERLLVDPFVGAATVELLNYDGTTWMTLVEAASGDFLSYPLNETQKSELVLQPNARVAIFARAFENLLDVEDSPSGADVLRLVKITANFGASTTVPADVELAATKLVAKIAEKRLKGSDGSIKSESLGDYSISLGDVDEAAGPLGIYNILDQWREPSI